MPISPPTDRNMVIRRAVRALGMVQEDRRFSSSMADRPTAILRKCSSMVTRIAVRLRNSRGMIMEGDRLRPAEPDSL